MKRFTINYKLAFLLFFGLNVFSNLSFAQTCTGAVTYIGLFRTTSGDIHTFNTTVGGKRQKFSYCITNQPNQPATKDLSYLHACSSIHKMIELSFITGAPLSFEASSCTPGDNRIAASNLAINQ